MACAATNGATPQRPRAAGLGYPDREAIPKLRQGSYFSDWLLERRRRAEAALATSYLLRVSARQTEKLVETLGLTRLSESQDSEMAKDLDAQVEAFRTRPLDAGPTRSSRGDALVLKVRETCRTVERPRPDCNGSERRGVPEIPGPARDLR